MKKVQFPLILSKQVFIMAVVGIVFILIVAIGISNDSGYKSGYDTATKSAQEYIKELVKLIEDNYEVKVPTE